MYLLRKIFILAIFSLSCVSLQAGAGKPERLMTDLAEHTDKDWDGRTALIGSKKPCLSWIVPGSGTQLSYRIVFYEGSEVIWDSGDVDDGNSTAVPYEGPELKPSKDYYWTVSVNTDKDGQSDWSDLKRFRTAETLEDYVTPAYPLVTEKERPVSLVKAPNGNMLADFGKDAFGRLAIRLESSFDGEAVLAHIGEELRNGQVFRNPTTSVRYYKYPILLSTGSREYSPEMVPDKRNTGKDAVKLPGYIGVVAPFRYCEIEGYGGKLAYGDLTRVSVHYPFDDNAAYFKCSDETLNAIWELCHHTVKATSFTGIYIDGDRERIPYEADALINQLCHYASDREYTMARRSLEYLLEHPTWPTEWIEQSVMIAWNDYMATGDKRLLEKEYALLEAHALLALKDSAGLVSTTTGRQDKAFLNSIKREDTIRDIVDWPRKVPEVDGITGGSDGFVFKDYNAVVNAYHYEDLVLLSQIARVLGKENEAARYQAEAETFLETFNEAFFDKADKRYTDGIGTDHAALHSNIFPLAFGIVPEDRIADVADYVVSKGMSCGVYAAQFLLEALYETGRADAALALLRSKSTSSWHNMIEKGATMAMEAWDDTFKPNQDWNHAWGAAPGNIIPNYLMGVRPELPGWEVALVKPQVAGLEWAEISVPTIRGSIYVRIENGKDRLTMTVKTPANVKCHAVLPLNGAFKDFGIMEPGEHTFSVKKP